MTEKSSLLSRSKVLSAENKESLLQKVPNQPTLKVVQPHQNQDALARFAQLIMYGIALLAIWAGIFSIAFDDDATNENFLILGLGGIISAGMAFALVEIQRKRGGDELQNVHDYLLGIGCFFSATGVLWGSRYLIGVSASMGYDWFMPSGTTFGDEWSPSANAIYVQLGAGLALIFGLTKYIRSFKSGTSFGWLVTSLIPLALVLAGVGPWIDWSNNVISWELGISIVVLTILSMHLSLQSDNSFLFSSVLVITSMVPIIYEVLNSNAPVDGRGGALSLFVFIIIAQGLYAADDRIRKGLMESTSAILISISTLSIFIARSEDLFLILGPVRESMLGEFSVFLNLQSMIWFVLLCSFFPAMIKQRVPWMPIGLGLSMSILEPGPAVIGWVAIIFALPYMLFISTVTRKWVANYTLIALAIAFTVQDLLAPGFYFQYQGYGVAIYLLVVGEIARTKGRVNSIAHFASIGIIVCSPSILMGDSYLIAWGMVVYSFYVTYSSFISSKKKLPDQIDLESSLLLTFSIFVTTVLTLGGQLQTPWLESISISFSGFNLMLFILALAVWYIGLQFKQQEMDLGHFFSWLAHSGDKNLPVFDSSTSTWIANEETIDYSDKSWGPLSRISYLGPLFLISLSLSSIGEYELANTWYWLVVCAFPVGLIFYEIFQIEEPSSADRAIGIWGLVCFTMPLTFRIYDIANQNPAVIWSFVIFDLLIIAAPLIIVYRFLKYGISSNTKNKDWDQLAFFGLFTLTLLDTSGGLAFLSLYVLLVISSLRFKNQFFMSAAPFALILFGSRMANPGDVIYELWHYLGLGEVEIFVIADLGLPRLSGILMATSAFFVLTFGIFEAKKNNGEYFPIIWPSIWLFIGMLTALPETAWLFLSLTFMMVAYSTLTGKIEFLKWSPILIFFSFIVGFNADPNFQMEADQIFSFSSMYMGIYAIGLQKMAQEGLLSRLMILTFDDALVMNFQKESVKLADQLSFWGVFGLLFSWEAVNGIGTVIGAGWTTIEVYKNKRNELLILLPAVHAFAAWNLIRQSVDQATYIDLVTGGTMLIEGAILGYYASKPQKVWDWEFFEFDTQKDYFNWLDRVGMISVIYFALGTLWALENTETGIFAWTILAAYLSTISVQGFQEENDAVWRRGIGGFGSLFSVFMISMEFESTTYRAVSWLAMGVMAFGYGLLYMQMFGNQTSVMEQAIPVQSIPANQEEKHTTLLARTGDMSNSDTEETESELADADEEQVMAEKEKLSEEEDDDIEMEEEGQESDENLEQTVDEYFIPPPVLAEKTIDTGQGFEIKLPTNILDNILKAIEETPHEGFKPTLEFNKSGEIMLHFEPV